MSHQGHEGWFPECLVCGLGNVGAIVCLDPTCHEQHDGSALEPSDDKLRQIDGLWWVGCQLCDSNSISEPASWGTYAICTGCFNAYMAANRLPPTSPRGLLADTQKQILTFESGTPIVRPA